MSKQHVYVLQIVVHSDDPSEGASIAGVFDTEVQPSSIVEKLQDVWNEWFYGETEEEVGEYTHGDLTMHAVDLIDGIDNAGWITIIQNSDPDINDGFRVVAQLTRQVILK